MLTFSHSLLFMEHLLCARPMLRTMEMVVIGDETACQGRHPEASTGGHPFSFLPPQEGRQRQLRDCGNSLVVSQKLRRRITR